MARGKTWALGTAIFAATMMIVLGVFQFFQGLAAVIRGEFYVVAPNYVYSVDTTAWGWIHMGLGALLVLTGCFLFTGATWARVVGIGLVSLSAIANFFYLPYYPLWAMLIIALDVVIIWALATASLGSRTEDEISAGYGTGVASGYTPQHTGTQTMRDSERWPATNQAGGRGWAGEQPKMPADRGQQVDQAQEAAEQAAHAAERRGGPQPG